MALSTKPHPKKTIEVLGKTMRYVEMGEGAPIVFLHGNPTSSYLWRNIMPHLKDLGRCLAPDLIGMGDSEKLEGTGDDRYRFREHKKYVAAFLEKMGVDKNVVLVIHDWGSALGFDWAHANQDKVKAIAYMEAIVKPFSDWDSWPEAARQVFQGFRSEAGEGMVLKNNIFVERVLPGSILRKLQDEEMAEYRRPFAEEGEARRPTLTWPRQIPIGGDPADVADMAESYAAWMAENDLPKFFVHATPGAIMTKDSLDFCRGWKNQTEISVKGGHFVQEDAPDEIGKGIANWLQKL